MGGLTEYEGGSEQTLPQGAVAISGVKNHEGIKLTLLGLDAKGAWRYGEEVPCERREITLGLVRRENGGKRERIINFVRKEHVIDPGVALTHGFSAGAYLCTAILSSSQRRVQSAVFQNYGAGAGAFCVEDLDLTKYRLKDGLKWADLADNDAIQRLHELPVDLFSSERVVRASIPLNVGAPFVGYEDEDYGVIQDREPKHAKGDIPRTHHHLGPRRGQTETAFGIVPDTTGGKKHPIGAVRAALYSDPRLSRIFKALGDCTYLIPVFRGGGISHRKMPLELSGPGLSHFDLAISQALAGAGLKDAEWKGKEVALYVINLFEAHMRNALDRIEGHLPPDPDT